MNDEDLIKDMEQATRRLDDSLKVCRKIISSYRTSLARIAGKHEEDGARLFEWPDGTSDAHMRADATSPGDHTQDETGNIEQVSQTIKGGAPSACPGDS
jgi:hypothetical protein